MQVRDDELLFDLFYVAIAAQLRHECLNCLFGCTTISFMLKYGIYALFFVSPSRLGRSAYIARRALPLSSLRAECAAVQRGPSPRNVSTAAFPTPSTPSVLESTLSADMAFGIMLGICGMVMHATSLDEPYFVVQRLSSQATYSQACTAISRLFIAMRYAA